MWFEAGNTTTCFVGASSCINLGAKKKNQEEEEEDIQFVEEKDLKKQKRKKGSFPT